MLNGQVKNLNGKGASGVRAAVPFQDGDDDGIGWFCCFRGEGAMGCSGVEPWRLERWNGRTGAKSPTNRSWQKPDGPRETRARLMAAVAFR